MDGKYLPKKFLQLNVIYHFYSRLDMCPNNLQRFRIGSYNQPVESSELGLDLFSSLSVDSCKVP